MVDDSPEKHTRNYGNLIRVKPFEGDPSDDELVHLEKYLEFLSKEADVRHIEKRGWRKILQNDFFYGRAFSEAKVERKA